MLSGLERFRHVFSNRHAVLPVIHVSDFEQAMANAWLALESGADGVFLINHAISDDELIDIHARVAGRLGRWWVGLNCLGLDPREGFGRLSREVAGLWVDDAKIDELAEAQPAAVEVMDARGASGWDGLYFGGVAFKYQREVRDPAAAASAARDYVDVVTTSGPATGRAAEVEKIRAMKSALGDGPLAIASGITPDNIHDYLPHADCFLVATGISRSFLELDPTLLARLVGAVRAHDQESRRLTWHTNVRRHRAALDPTSADEVPGVNHVIHMTDLTRGPVFEIDLCKFPEPEPLFAYWDDGGSSAEALDGLVEVGPRVIGHEADGRLHRSRECLLFRASRAQGERARLRSRSVGEFCCEIHHISPDDASELLWCDSFCLK